MNNNKIKIPEGAIPLETAQHIVDELLLVEPKDIPVYALAIKDLDPDEVEVLQIVLKALMRKIHHRKAVTNQHLVTVMDRAKEKIRVQTMLADKGKIFTV